MAKKKILFISQEIMPYLPESEMAHIGRYLPQGIQEKGKEIRTFMPRYGCINERRNQVPVHRTHTDTWNGGDDRRKGLETCLFHQWSVTKRNGRPAWRISHWR